MGNRLSDYSLRTLQKIAKATENAVGPDSPSVIILRRAIAAKRREVRSKGKPPTAGGRS